MQERFEVPKRETTLREHSYRQPTTSGILRPSFTKIRNPSRAEALRQYRDDAEVLLFVANKALQTSRVSDAEFNASSLVEKDLATKARD